MRELRPEQRNLLLAPNQTGQLRRQIRRRSIDRLECRKTQLDVVMSQLPHSLGTVKTLQSVGPEVEKSAASEI